MIVVDASALIEALLQTPSGQRTLDRLEALGGDLHAPSLLDIEVAQTFRRLAHQGVVEARRCDAAIDDLLRFPVRRWDPLPLLPRVWALRGALSAYDAAYIALAEALDAPLVTLDQKLATSTGHRARVIVPTP